MILRLSALLGGADVGGGGRQNEAAGKVKTCYSDRSDRTWKAACSNTVHIKTFATADVSLNRSSSGLGA